MTNHHGRTTLTILFVAGALSVAAPAAAGGFEGAVTQHSVVVPNAALKPLVGEGDLTAEKVLAIPADKIAALASDPASGARPLNAVIHVKGTKFRVDMMINDKPGFLIVDSATDTTWIAVPDDKVYIEWTQADHEAMTAKADAQRKKIEMLRAQEDKLSPEDRSRLEAALGPTPVPTVVAPTPAVKKLEQSDTINGVKVTAYELRQGATVSRGWLSSEHPDLLAAFVAASKSQQSVRPTRPSAIEVLSAHGLPVRVQTFTPDHYEQVDLVEIDAEAVPDAQFTVPADFKKVDLNATPAAAAAAPAAPAETPTAK